MTVRQNHPGSQGSDSTNLRLFQGGILAVVAVATLWLTGAPEAVPVVVAPVALAFGVRG